MYTTARAMTTNLVTLREGDALGTAETLLALGHIRHLPVVRGKKLVGLLTHRDLLRASLRDPSVCAREVMIRELTTVTPDTPMREAIRLMLTNQYGCLPVIAADGTLVGLVTEADLLRVADERLEELDRRESAAEYDSDA